MKQIAVPSYISNISAPKTPEQLFNFMYNRKGYDVEAPFRFESIDWTAPKWATRGAIVFFMHAAYANQSLNAVKKQLCANKQNYSQEKYDDAMAFIKYGKELHKKLGGHIFAIARVVDRPSHWDDDPNDSHYWKSRIYAHVGDFCILDKPVGIEEFRSFITIARQSSVTPVVGNDFERLRELIIAKNSNVPDYLQDAVVSTEILSKINKDNWLEKSSKYRSSFFLEIQFRKYYVDYFLSLLGDQKTTMREARVRKSGMHDSFVDNIILFKGKFLPVEVKINVDAEANIVHQLEKYCNCDSVYRDSGVTEMLDQSMIYRNYVLVFDTKAVYLYDDRAKSLSEIYKLDKVKDIREIQYIKEKLITLLS